MIDPKATAAAQIERALSDPGVADDVTCMTLALCRLDQGDRAELLHRAHALLDDHVTGDAITRQHVQRERLRGYPQADGEGSAS